MDIRGEAPGGGAVRCEAPYSSLSEAKDEDEGGTGTGATKGGILLIVNCSVF